MSVLLRVGSFAGVADGEVGVCVVPKQIADEIIRQGHYSGSVVWSSGVHFGIYVRQRLVGAMQFGPAMNPASGAKVVRGTAPDQWLELNRLWIADGQPENTASRAVAYGVKLLRHVRPAVAWVQTFADSRCEKAGGLYQACSFLYLGSHKTHFYLLDGEWYHRSMMGRSEYDKRGWWCGPKIAYLNANKERAVKHEFTQYRYLRPLTKWALRNLQMKTLPYPKPHREPIK